MNQVVSTHANFHELPAIESPGISYITSIAENKGGIIATD